LQLSHMELLLSLFPGIDLLGRGFEAEGFCVVRGPDILWGGDIKDFHCPAGCFNGVIGGSPCQDFSGINRNPGEYSLEMLKEYCRVVVEIQPQWFLLENVARVPDIKIPNYKIQRFDLNAYECGLRQSRLRHFQFGSKEGYLIVPERKPKPKGMIEPVCLASEGDKPDRRDWSDFCELQGLPRDFDLPDMSLHAKYKAVGNGVPIPMARNIARAIIERHIRMINVRLCVCGCGRILSGNQLMAKASCRKRMERRRKCDPSIAVTCRQVTM
jgi:DNA (cytosine-5)-methyltransferase 1